MQAALTGLGPLGYRAEQQITEGIGQAFAALSNACTIAYLLCLTDEEFERRILDARALLLNGVDQHNRQADLLSGSDRSRLERSGLVGRKADPVDALRYLSDVAARLRELRRSNQRQES